MGGGGGGWDKKVLGGKFLKNYLAGGGVYYSRRCVYASVCVSTY